MEVSTLMVVIVAIIGSSGLTALINGLFNRKPTKAESGKKEAEADNIIGQAYGALLKDFRQQLADLKKDFFLLKVDHNACTEANKVLIQRIEDLEKKTKNTQ